MIEIKVPGYRDYRLAHLTLDVNGTLALDGQLIEGVGQRLVALGENLKIHLLTADTFGALAEIEDRLGFPGQRIRGSDEKAAFVQKLDPRGVVAVGNGANDAEMLSTAALGIAVLGPEGMAREAMEAADLIAPNIVAALDLLLKPKRLVATLRR